MKHRNNFKYILPVACLLCLMLGMGACVREEFAEVADTNEYSSVAIRVKMPEQTIVKPMTRAEALQFDELVDMNILISEKGTISRRIYLDFVNMTWGDETPIEAGTENADGVTVTPTGEANGYKEFQLTFSDTYLKDINLKSCEFHVVANWGSAITETDVKTLLKQTVSTVTTDLGDGIEDRKIVPTPNVMYGEIISEDSEIIDPANPVEMRRVVTVGLKRTAAMITLAIDGSDLNQNVVIHLESVTLRNVPTFCTLGPGNKPTDHERQIGSYGDFRGGTMLANGYDLVGDARYNNVDGYKEANGYSTRIGGHYTSVDGNVTNVNNDLVRPMFLFENMQGTGEPTGEQTKKRPVGVGDSEQAIKDYNETGVCSYIEVNATYTEYGTGMDVTGRGPVTWRFFLGSNTTDNFDVQRNTNYQVTLKLSGSGISEADVSWRVDADLEKTQVVGTSDMVFGGGDEMACVEFASGTEGVNKNLKLVGADASFVYAYSLDRGWLQISEAGNKAYKWFTTGEKQMWFYVQSLMPDDNTVQGNERSCTVSFQSPNNTEYAKVSFTQYRPVTFSITQDDLKFYPKDEDLKRAHEIIRNYYNHDVNAKGDFVFYADRVDRDPMPWGFSGVQLDKNWETGFENVYHLIKPLPGNEKPTCPGHIAYAENYLPTGKGFKDSNNYIDYSNGSCMMHAAMENYFLQYPNITNSGVTPEQLIGVTLDKVDRPSADNEYSWCVPSIAGYQLVEILDRFYKRYGIIDRGFDPEYPISKWTAYWTSNSATADLKGTYPNLVPPIDGKNRSFVYQFDMGLDEIREGDQYPARLLMPRATSIRYRLLTIRPDLSSSGNPTK